MTNEVKFIAIEHNKYSSANDLYENVGKIKAKSKKAYPWITEQLIFYIKMLGNGKIAIEGINASSLMIGENSVTALEEVWKTIDEHKNLIAKIANQFKELNNRPIWKTDKTIVLRKKVKPQEQEQPYSEVLIARGVSTLQLGLGAKLNC